MAPIFRTDSDRDRAAKLRRLLLRVQNGAGEDRNLGTDIREAFELPYTAGDPIGCIDCALAIAQTAKYDRVEAIAWATKALQERVRDGWKAAKDISAADVARTICGIVLKCQIAKLEGTPA